jgi:hypothetical protein
MIWDGGDVNEIQAVHTMEQIQYVKKQSREKNYCELIARFSVRLLEYWKRLPYEGFKTEKSKTTQREMAGNLRAQIDGEGIHVIDVNMDSMIHGAETGVKIVDGLYNFHSHPQNAYKKYQVELGWPSGQDYIGFLMAIIDDGTIFHCVITLEGIYVISLTREWATRVDELTKNATGDYIDKNYNMRWKSGDTIQWYLQTLHSLSYKGAGPLFRIEYIPWAEAQRTFSLKYGKLGGNCFTCERTRKMYKEIYM